MKQSAEDPEFKKSTFFPPHQARGQQQDERPGPAAAQICRDQRPTWPGGSTRCHSSPVQDQSTTNQLGCKQNPTGASLGKLVLASC